MEKSILEKIRSEYKPKLPQALKGNVKAVEGEPTNSVRDQQIIKSLFPNTYGMPKTDSSDSSSDPADSYRTSTWR